MATSIIYSIMQSVANHMAQKLITEISPTDPTRAGVVREGKLQDAPTTGKINLLIHTGGPEWPDVLYTPDKRGTVGISAPTYEIGSTFQVSYWMRRFRVEFEMFFVGINDRSVARNNAMIVLSRAHSAILTTPLPQGNDTFGESASIIQVSQSYTEEGGGIGNFIWSGEIRFEVLTYIDPELAP
ncbi:MAG: hypothetical protein CUN55_00520 [Phototrophicales bacterium]|nr:MAG: hypothetical protein CUN55_00520 [Phototrophicales bacterium]